MKIAIICYYHIDATISLVKYLKKIDKNLEIDFIFLFSQSDKNSTPITFSNISVRNGFLNDDEILKVIDKEVLQYLNGIVNLKIFLFNSWNQYDYKNYILLNRLRRKLNKGKYNLIHFIGNQRLIIYLNILTNIKVKFHMIHEPYPHIIISQRRLLIHKLLMRWLVRSGSHITVPSKTSYDRFNKYFNVKQNKISIVGFSQFEIYKEYIKKEITKSDKIILFYGIIKKYKGVEVLLEAMEKVITVLPDLKLIIAGRGKINYDITNLGQNFEIINRHITNEEIAELNQMATLVVCPYYSASQSGVVMTSFAFNNPVLATNVGALQEVIEDSKTGVLIEYPDSDILAKKIIDLFENSDKINKLRDNIIYKYSKTDYSWDNIASQYYKLIQFEISGKI